MRLKVLRCERLWHDSFFSLGGKINVGLWLLVRLLAYCYLTSILMMIWLLLTQRFEQQTDTV